MELKIYCLTENYVWVTHFAEYPNKISSIPLFDRKVCKLLAYNPSAVNRFITTYGSYIYAYPVAIITESVF